jgi:diadenosine tetraphosphate (Ap4A) HIT family hydrolase
MTSSDCPLCQADGGILLWRDALCRVVLADEADYPGFLRVILDAHVREMTDLPVAERGSLMKVVFACEAALREVMAPDKINLASLGNVVPHLHWHVIPRFGDDPHFPNPVWGVRQRDSRRAVPTDLDARLAAAINRLLAHAPEKG